MKKRMIILLVLLVGLLVLPKDFEFFNKGRDATELLWTKSEEDGIPYYVTDENNEIIDGEFINVGTEKMYAKEGKIVTGWQMIEGEWYYFDNEGLMISSQWVSNGDNWFYMNYDGKMVADKAREIDGVVYMFDESGVMNEEEKLYVDGSVSSNISEKYLEDILAVPYDIRKYVDDYYVTAYRIENKFNISRKGFISGLYNGEDVWLQGSEAFADVALHESLHAFDRHHFPGQVISETAEFDAAVQSDKNGIPYNATNVQTNNEAFVECAVLYIKDKETLAYRCPNIYEYFEKTAFAGVELGS